MLKVCLEKMASILLYIIKSTEHMKLDQQQIMNLGDELKMDIGMSAESTPKKTDRLAQKRKLEINPNETQGPKMQNHMNPVYKPNPA